MRPGTPLAGALLIALCLGVSGAASQEAPERPEAPRAPEGGPSPERPAGESPGDAAEQPQWFSIEIRILPSPEETERAQDEARRAEERQQQDLEAQWQMAESAREMVPIGWWQIGVGGFGAILLAASLVFSARAAKAAAVAAHAAEQTLHADRAWMTQDGFEAMPFHNGYINGQFCKYGLMMTVSWRNTGRSPALQADCFINHRLVRPGEDVPAFPVSDIQGHERRPSLIGPGIAVSSSVRAINDHEYEALKKQTCRLFIYSRIDYRDIYKPDVPRYTEFCAEVSYNGERVDSEGRSYPNIVFIPIGKQNAAS